MAVTVKGFQSYQSGSGGFLSSHTMTDLDSTGTDTYVVAAGFNRNPASDVSSWTFEGNTPTTLYDNANANVVAVQTRGLAISDADTTIVSNTPSFKLQAMIGVAFEGVDQTTPDASTGTNTAGTYGSTATLAYTGTSGNMLLVFISTQNDRNMTASNCTTIAEVDHADGNLGTGWAGYVEATGSTQTIGATLSSADNWRLVIVELTAATAGDDYTLASNDMALSLTEDSTTVAQVHVIAPQDTTLSTRLDSTTIVQNHVISAADIALALSEDNTTINLNVTISSNDISLSLSADNTTISQNHILTAQDVLLSTRLDSTTITQNHVLVVQDITHSLTEDNTTVLTGHLIAPNDITLSLALDSSSLAQNHVLISSNILLNTALDSISGLVPSQESPIIIPIIVSEEEQIDLLIVKRPNIELTINQKTSSITVAGSATSLTITRSATLNI